MKNKQLTSVQRNQIEVLLKTKTPIKKVAQLLDTDKSTIYREINRNKKKRSYSASFAGQFATERKERFGRTRKFTIQTRDFIVEKLTKE
ncbi:MAG: helix-turn-helix domain-containing protein [Peptostreptococcaceae bacterium]|nr:helix-turn-helix domain-containing protein [Peptostreptococcaceae bacterium]